MAAAEAVALLEALRAQAAEVTAHGREMLRRVRGGQLETKEGVSLLQVRCHALLSYLQDLALLVCSKAQGRSLGGSSCSGGALERLLETRVVLEKLRPLEQRLKHHLEKLLRAAALGGRGVEDPLNFRPAPSNMAAQDADDDDDDDEGKGGGAKAPGLGGGRRYVPPRLVPVSCAGPAPPQERSQLRSRLRALGSAALRDLREELGEGPREEGAGLLRAPRTEIQREELGEGPREEGAGLLRAPRTEIQRIRYEESMLQRLSAPWRPRRLRGAGPDLDDVTNFGAFPALLGEATNQDSSEPPKKKRKKAKMGKKKGKKGFRRRR